MKAASSAVAAAASAASLTPFKAVIIASYSVTDNAALVISSVIEARSVAKVARVFGFYVAAVSVAFYVLTASKAVEISLSPASLV